jgi:hypothetical protein
LREGKGHPLQTGAPLRTLGASRRLALDYCERVHEFGFGHIGRADLDRVVVIEILHPPGDVDQRPASADRFAKAGDMFAPVWVGHEAVPQHTAERLAVFRIRVLQNAGNIINELLH